MDHNEMVNMARDYARQRPFLQFASLFNPERVKGFNKVRVGSETDGGYVMLDDYKDIQLALSFGVDINADWDVDVAEKGVPVQQYDHSISMSPVHHPRISFFKKMITAQTDGDNEASVPGILASTGLATDASVILKMDIESAEWDVFESCTVEELGRFSQILVEFHDIDRAVDPYWLLRATRVMKKLRERFGVFHVHANNWSPMAVIGNVYFPGTIEVSFANKSRYQFENTDELFPTSLDRPNNPLRPDIYLGSFKFKTM
jgi:hypothetical protein